MEIANERKVEIKAENGKESTNAIKEYIWLR